MDVKESYQVLELELGASRAAVDAAYLRLIERWHPDHAESGGPEAVREAQRMIQAINDAYHALAKIAPTSAEAAAPTTTSAAPAAGSKPRLRPTGADPAAPVRPKLPPLAAGQPAAGRPPSPPPAATWAARPDASAAGAAPPPTPAPPPLAFPAPPSKSLPPLPPPISRPPQGRAPPPPEPVAPRPKPPAEESSSPEGAKTVGLYDQLFPPDSPSRRFGPFILAATLVVVLLLGKCAISSSRHKNAQGPDPKTTGRLVVKSNVANTTIEAILIPPAGKTESASVKGPDEGASEQALSGLRPGKYAVIARSEKWAEIRQEVTVDAARTTEVTINFQGGSLRLDSDPEGATVHQGGAVLGRTPLVIPLLPPGECQLTLEYPSWPAASFKTTITAGVESSGTVRLPHGKLTVESRPPGATVLLGKRVLGQTPVTLEPFPAGTRKLTLRAKDFPPLEVAVTMEDRGEVIVSPALGSGFPLLDPEALLRAIWIPDNPDRIAPPIEGVTGPSRSQNGIVRNLNRKKLYEAWLRRQYRYTAIIKSYDRATGQVEFAEQPGEYSKYRILAKLPVEARNDSELAAQLVKGATFAIYGRLSAVEEPRWPFRVITFEFSPAEPLR